VKLLHAIFLFVMMFSFQAVSATETANPEDAKKLIQDNIDKVLVAIKNEPDNAIELAKAQVLPYFDFVAMSRLVVGKNWRSATNEQKKTFVLAFRDLLVRTYSNTLNEAANSEVEVEYLPVHAKAGDNRVKVQTVVKYAGKSIDLDYSLHAKKGSWKVWDVSAGGVSLVTNYRSEFQKIFKENGMDGLIEAVNKKNSDG
jgi:phospholipid transport system substrate-binding protein